MNPHTIASALQFMVDRTNGERKGGTPKFLHPIRVALTLAEAGCSEETVIAGLLHDILEETETTYNELESRFGIRVAQIVQSLSHGEENDEEILQRVKEGGEEAVKIKLADNMDNIRTIHNFKPDRRESYLQYANKINDLGWKVLGYNHPLLSLHGEMYKFAYNLPF